MPCRLSAAAVNKFQGQKLPSATAERLGVHLREADRARSTDSGDGSASESGSRDRGPIADPFDAERGFNARRALELVKNVADWMTDIHGRRKALVLFSEGIDYDISDVFNNTSATGLMQDARDAVAAAHRANVGIYAVDPRGLTQLADETIGIASLSDDPQLAEVSPAAFQRELLLSQESLVALAEETGGTAAVRSNDLAGALARIARENSTYYLLGYQTDPSRSPGKFRKLDVRVKRPGVRVRVRRGYVPPDSRTLARARDTETQAGTSVALKAALSNPLPIGEVPMRVFAAPFKGTGRNASVLLAVEIDGAGLKFAEQAGRFNEKVEVSMVAADHQGNIRGTDRKTITYLAELYDNSVRTAHSVDFTATVRAVDDGRVVFRTREERAIEAGNQLRTHGHKGEIPLTDIAPGSYVLRVEATSRAGNQFAFREVPFVISGAPRVATH